ncbi:hypothetical protein D9M71_579180 [compost metagenome]
MVGQADAGLVGGLHQHADVVANSGVVAVDLDFTVVAAGRNAVQGRRFQRTVDAVDGRAEADRHLVVEGIADGRLNGYHRHLALGPEVTAGKAVFVVSDQAERGVDADTEGPLVVDWLDVVAHGYADERNHIAVGAAAEGAAAADVGAGDDGSCAAGYLLALEARHACRVTKYCACIFGSGGAASKTSAHATDALFVEGKATGENLSGCHGNCEAESGFEHYFFHY